MKQKAVFAVVVAFAGMAVACASTFPPPNNEVAAAQGDVGRAQTGGAPSVPDAKLHLQLAEEDLQKAKALIGTDNQRAASLTAVASAEAQLALSLGQQAEAEARARQAQAALASAATK
jgi:multidrug efflux pump subunit AcrA (membrane-fusion protein)